MKKPVLDIGKMNMPKNEIKQHRRYGDFSEGFSNTPEYAFPVFWLYLIFNLVNYRILDFCH